MEKTVQITIASMQFQVTESAYNTLRAYLDRLSAHFGEQPDGIEILRDIESRIAEKFIDGKHKLVTDKDVNAVMAEIGDAAAFSDESDPETEPAPPKDVPARKRLYRDVDNAYVGGVASGISAYFGIDPIWIRGAFLLSIFTGGAGIVIYLILWMLIPEAKSASQKLEMNGQPVNLDTIASVVKDRFDEAEKSGAFKRGAHAIDFVVRRVFTLIGTVIGAFLSLGSFFAIIGATVLLGIVLINWNAPWNDLPIKAVISPALLWIGLLAVYTATIVPLVFIFTLGFRWMMRRSLLTTTVGFGLMGIWALALVGGGVTAAKIGGDYFAYTSSSPEHARVVDARDLEAFTALVADRADVRMVQGETYSVKIEGRQMDMGNVTIENVDGVLTVAAIDHEDPKCFFVCHDRTPAITVTTPTLETLTLRSSSASLELEVDRFVVNAKNASIRGKLKSRETLLTLESSHMSLALTSASTTLSTEGGHVRLDGTGDHIHIVSRNSSVDADSFLTTSTGVDARNSFVEVNSSEDINVVRDDSSTIQNAGSTAGVSETSQEN